MRNNTCFEQISPLEKIIFQNESMAIEPDFFNLFQSTHSSEMQISEKTKVPEYEIAYSMDLEPPFKLPRIADCVNAPPQLQSPDDMQIDFEDYGNLPFDFK